MERASDLLASAYRAPCGIVDNPLFLSVHERGLDEVVVALQEPVTRGPLANVITGEVRFRILRLTQYVLRCIVSYGHCDKTEHAMKILSHLIGMVGSLNLKFRAQVPKMRLINIDGTLLDEFPAPMCDGYLDLDVIVATDAFILPELKARNCTVVELMEARGWQFCPPEVGHALSDHLDQWPVSGDSEKVRYLDHLTRHFYVAPRKDDSAAIAA